MFNNNCHCKNQKEDDSRKTCLSCGKNLKKIGIFNLTNNKKYMTDDGIEFVFIRMKHYQSDELFVYSVNNEIFSKHSYEIESILGKDVSIVLND